MNKIFPIEQLDARRFDAPEILKRLASSSRQLAELKGIAASIPNQSILINTLGLKEAKDSSEWKPATILTGSNSAKASISGLE